MWRTETTQRWQLALQRFDQEHPEAVSSLLRNLTHFASQLRVAKSPKSIECSYLCKHAGGITSVSSNDWIEKDVELRAYCFVQETRRVISLLTIGQVAAENADMEYAEIEDCRTAIMALMNVT